MPPPTPIRVALDWTPNTIHSGLYLALTHSLYARANLAVTLLPPSPTYPITPAKLLESGAVDLAICPSESCIAYAESGKMPLQAIYAILQRDASAVVSTRVSSLKKLGEGALYGSYNARYEDSIVRAMVDADGGNGAGVRMNGDEGKLGLFAALKRGDVDATWVFMPWEGVEAEMEGTTLHVFRTEELGVPYGYSPVIARNAAGALGDDALRRFVAATKEGYEMAVRDVEASVAALEEHCVPTRSKEFLTRSQRSINPFYGEDSLGSMQAAKWETWVGWLKEKSLLNSEHVRAESLFTNEFFKDG